MLVFEDILIFKIKDFFRLINYDFVRNLIIIVNRIPENILNPDFFQSSVPFWFSDFKYLNT